MIKLLTVLPKIYRSIKDFIALMNAVEPTFDEIEDNISKVYRNFYIQTCDTTTLEKLEKLCGLKIDENQTLEIRRAIVLDIFISALPYTLVKLKEKLNTICGTGKWKLDIDYNNYLMKVELLKDNPISPDEAAVNFITMIPAHICYYFFKTIYIESEVGYQNIGGYTGQCLIYESYSEDFEDKNYSFLTKNYEGGFISTLKNYKGKSNSSID